MNRYRILAVVSTMTLFVGSFAEISNTSAADWDIPALQYYLLGKTHTLANPSIYDMDENGVLNVSDLTLCKRKLLSPVQEESEWKLLWNDEFDGNSVDMSKWGYDLGNWLLNESGGLESYGWGNNEQEFYTDTNTSVSNGILTIATKKEPYTDPVQGNYEYTSARMSTKQKFSFCGGKVEVRARVDSGKSLWPAIWMLPEDTVYGKWAASGEIDIMEGWGSKPQQICGTIHFGDTWPYNTYLTKDYYFADDDSTENWHTYGLEWDAEKIRWLVDGVCYSEQSDWYSAGRAFPAPFDQNFYLILNLAVGGQFDGIDGVNADPSIFANGSKNMQIDYVRVYQKTEHTFTPTQLKEPSLNGYFEGADAELKNTDAGTAFTIRSVGTLEYGVMGIYGGQHLEAGKTYRISFDAAASVPRTMRLTVEDGVYNRYLDELISLSTDSKSYSYTITVPETMDADIKFQLGAVGDTETLSTHTVNLAKISLTDVQ